MKFPILTDRDHDPLPLTLEQYLEFCEFSLQFSKPNRIREQKDREEQITTPFRLVLLQSESFLNDPPITKH